MCIRDRLCSNDQLLDHQRMFSQVTNVEENNKECQILMLKILIHHQQYNFGKRFDRRHCIWNILQFSSCSSAHTLDRQCTQLHQPTTVLLLFSHYNFPDIFHVISLHLVGIWLKEGSWASARQRCWSWSKDWVQTRCRNLRVLRKQSSLSATRRCCFTLFCNLNVPGCSLFINSLFQGEEDHNLLFHSVKLGNKQAFDVVLKRSDVSWQNNKGTPREEGGQKFPKYFAPFLFPFPARTSYPQGPLLYIGQWRRRSTTLRRPC